MAQTHTIWNPSPPEEILTQIRNKVEEMRLAMKTDGVSYCEPPFDQYPGTGPLSVKRNWLTETDAQEFINYLLTVGTLESYTITP